MSSEDIDSTTTTIPNYLNGANGDTSDNSEAVADATDASPFSPVQQKRKLSENEAECGEDSNSSESSKKPRTDEAHAAGTNGHDVPGPSRTEATGGDGGGDGDSGEATSAQEAEPYAGVVVKQEPPDDTAPGQSDRAAADASSSNVEVKVKVEPGQEAVKVEPAQEAVKVKPAQEAVKVKPDEVAVKAEASSSARESCRFGITCYSSCDPLLSMLSDEAKDTFSENEMVPGHKLTTSTQHNSNCNEAQPPDCIEYLPIQLETIPPIPQTTASIGDQLMHLTQLVNVVIAQNKTLQRTVCQLSGEVLALKRQVIIGNGATTELEQELLPKFPINCIEEFLYLEKDLQENIEAVNQLKAKFMRNGGNSVEEFLRRGIRNILTDELIMQFTWSGKSRSNCKANEKPRGKNTVFVKVLKDTCFEMWPDCNDVKMEKILQQYFLHAGDRVRSRMTKIKAQSSTSTSTSS